MVPYFAWTFFIRLVIYVVGTYLLSSQAPKGRPRDRFLNFGPIFLFLLSLCYDWGYLPFVILLPPVLQFTGLPTSFRICRPWFILFMLTGDGSGAAASEAPQSTPIIRTLTPFVTYRVSGGLAYWTGLWAHDMIIPTSPKLGTLSYLYRQTFTEFQTPAGVKFEAHAADYVQKHGLEKSVFGQIHGTVDGLYGGHFSSAKLVQLAKQKVRNRTPKVAIAIGSAAYVALEVGLLPIKSK